MKPKPKCRIVINVRDVRKVQRVQDVSCSTHTSRVHHEDERRRVHQPTALSSHRLFNQTPGDTFGKGAPTGLADGLASQRWFRGECERTDPALQRDTDRKSVV